MHSYYQRVNTVFFTAVYSLAFVSIFYGLLRAATPFKGELLRFDNATVDNMMSDRRENFIFPFISLNLKYDLSKDWNYNTRSIYAYLVVSFEGDNESHEMIMWDKVIMSREDCTLDATIDNMYVLFNDDKSIFGKKLTISFRYQLQPTVGFQRDYIFPQVQEVMVPEKK